MSERKNDKTMRDSGIELLRIIMMLQVIFLHICDHGGYRNAAFEFNGKHELLYMTLWLMSRCPVYVFILIFGYFSVNSNKTIDDMKRRIPKIYLPMIFYSVTISFLGLAAGQWELSTQEKIQSFLPVTSRLWYFMSLYILVLILSPFINRCLVNLSKKEYLFLISFLFIIFCIWVPLSKLDVFSDIISVKFVVNLESGKSLYCFIFMYMLGGFIKLHVPKYNKCKYRFLAAFVILGFLNLILYYVYPDYYEIIGYNSNPIAVIQCILLLLFFRDIKFKSKLINYIAGLTFGIYMIHDQKYIRNHIWREIITADEKIFYSNNLYPIKIILICVSIFIICAAIEQIRLWLFQLISFLYLKIKLKFKPIE